MSCQKESTTEPFNYEKDTPIWLKSKIDSMSTDPSYTNTIVVRYDWKKEYIYDIFVPINSCRYCLLFNPNGDKVEFSDSMEMLDFENNRNNEVIIWEWKN
jgi:hypothetical protein